MLSGITQDASTGTLSVISLPSGNDKQCLNPGSPIVLNLVFPEAVSEKGEIQTMGDEEA